MDTLLHFFFVSPCVRKLASDDPRVVPLALDTSKPEEIAAAAQAARDVTLLVNNADVSASANVLTTEQGASGARNDNAPPAPGNDNTVPAPGARGGRRVRRDRRCRYDRRPRKSHLPAGRNRALDA
jgi:hypothetical protein